MGMHAVMPPCQTSTHQLDLGTLREGRNRVWSGATVGLPRDSSCGGPTPLCVSAFARPRPTRPPTGVPHTTMPTCTAVTRAMVGREAGPSRHALSLASRARERCDVATRCKDIKSQNLWQTENIKQWVTCQKRSLDEPQMTADYVRFKSKPD